MIAALTWILIAVGGAFGAVCRWKLDGAAKRVLPQRPYLGIAMVNVVGSFAAGVAFQPVAASALTTALVSTGFLGGFTTFSTAVMDVWALVERREYATAGLLLVGVWGIGLVCAAAGMALTASLFSFFV